MGRASRRRSAIVLGLEGGEGALRFPQDVALPADQLAPKILPLTVVHERLVVGRSIPLVDHQFGH
jgi:hypothetical protein